MDSLGIIAMGFGAFLMFEAFKNQQPTPIAKARRLLKTASTPSVVASSSSSPTITTV